MIMNLTPEQIQAQEVRYKLLLAKCNLEKLGNKLYNSSTADGLNLLHRYLQFHNIRPAMIIPSKLPSKEIFYSEDLQRKAISKYVEVQHPRLHKLFNNG